MEFSKTAAVIFDMDGIIFDTERLYIESWKAVAREYDLNNVTDMAYRIIGVNDIMSRKVFTDYYQGTRDYDQCRKRVSEVFHSRYDGKIPVKPGVHEILAFLRERNIPVALASSTRIETVQRELKEAGLYQAFDHIIGGDMIKQSKPAPDIFLAAAEKLQDGGDRRDAGTGRDCLSHPVRSNQLPGQAPALNKRMLLNKCLSLVLKQVPVTCAVTCAETRAVPGVSLRRLTDEHSDFRDKEKQ